MEGHSPFDTTVFLTNLTLTLHSLHNAVFWPCLGWVNTWPSDAPGRLSTGGLICKFSDPTKLQITSRNTVYGAAAHGHQHTVSNSLNISTRFTEWYSTFNIQPKPQHIPGPCCWPQPRLSLPSAALLGASSAPRGSDTGSYPAMLAARVQSTCFNMCALCGKLSYGKSSFWTLVGCVRKIINSPGSKLNSRGEGVCGWSKALSFSLGCVRKKSKHSWRKEGCSFAIIFLHLCKKNKEKGMIYKKVPGPG